MNKNGKQWGLGSLSVVLAVIAVAFSMIHLRVGVLGDYIFSKLHLNIPYGIVSLILFVGGVWLGEKYPSHFFSKLGRNLSGFCLILFVVGILISIFS